MRLYLAHPIIHRHEVRKQELLFEKLTGVELLNPFYDTERNDIKLIDDGAADRFGMSLEIVENDLELIRSSDGLLYVPGGHESIGSAMEIAYAKQFGKPVYIIEPGELAKHIWLRYHAKEIFPTWDAFAKRHRPKRRGISTEEQIQRTCASLGTYTYHEVRNALVKKATKQKSGIRENVGFMVPTEKQLIYILSRSDWSKEISPPSKHAPATYEYNELQEG